MGITFIASGNTNIVRGSLTFATYRNAKVPDCMIPYSPDDPDTYTVPPELAHIVAHDKEVHALRLISSVTAKEARSIFERDTIPENEFNILKKIIYRFIDYCAMGHVRVPHEIPEFVLDFSHTISPKSFSGCNTPASQSIRWDSTSAKTITFTYSISSVTNYAISGSFSSSSPHISYSTTMAYRNRTANSVEVQATTTVTMQSGWSGYNYGSALKTTYGSVSTRACKLCLLFALFNLRKLLYIINSLYGAAEFQK